MRARRKEDGSRVKGKCGDCELLWKICVQVPLSTHKVRNHRTSKKTSPQKTSGTLVSGIKPSSYHQAAMLHPVLATPIFLNNSTLSVTC